MKSCVLECAELQEAEGKELHGSAHGPCERGVCVTSSAHGSAARAVQERKQSAWVFNTGHVREACNFHLPHTGRAAQHGPCPLFGLHGSRKASARGVFTRHANPIFRTRGLSTDRAKEVARVSVGFVRACDLARVTLGSARVTFASTRVKLGFARVVQFFFF